jgi:hypothetical protein
MSKKIAFSAAVKLPAKTDTTIKESGDINVIPVLAGF